MWISLVWINFYSETDNINVDDWVFYHLLRPIQYINICLMDIKKDIMPYNKTCKHDEAMISKSEVLRNDQWNIIKRHYHNWLLTHSRMYVGWSGYRAVTFFQITYGGTYDDWLYPAYHSTKAFTKAPLVSHNSRNAVKIKTSINNKTISFNLLLHFCLIYR